MNRQLSDALDISPESRRWTVLVQVVENSHVQHSRSGSDFKRLLLTDSKGTKFTALIYANHLRYFANLLSPYKRYYISNAMLAKNDPRFNKSSYCYSWILNKQTLLEEVVDPIPATLPCQFEFTKFSDLHKYADTDNLQNIRAIVLKCFPTNDHGEDVITRRDIVIVNEEKRLMLLTLWKDFDEQEGTALANMVGPKPLIFGMRLRATTFNSLSLTTRAGSGLMIEPPVSEELRMREWYNSNKEEIQLLLDQKTFNNPTILLPYPAEESIIPVATVVSSIKTLKTAWVKGKMTFPFQERSYWYTACGNCHKSLEADLTWIVTCPSCKLLSEIRPMARLTIAINDGSGCISTTMSTPEIEDFIPFTAIQLKESEEFGIDVSDEIAESICKHTIVAFIRSFETTFRGETELKMSVVKAYKSATPNLLPPNKASSFSGQVEQRNPVLHTSELANVGKRHTPSSSHASTAKDVAPQVTCVSPTKRAKDCSA